MAKKNRARVLQKSVRYPTYQLFATAGRSGQTPELQLVAGALTVLEWLRTKFREFEIPKEFDMPGAEDCANVTISDLKNARIDVGYSVETVCVPEEKAWAFRLTEPDLSTIREDGIEVSTAVPGRIFETNIAFRVVGSTMQCGVTVIVSEPENTKKPCRVLRPALVQLLAADPRIGLTSGCPIEEKLWELNSKEKLKNLRNYLGSAMLPAVVFCDLEEKREVPPLVQVKLTPITPAAFEASPIFSPSPLLPGMGRSGLELSCSGVVKSSAVRPAKKTFYIPYDVSRFIGARMGCVQSFHLPVEQFDNFRKTFQLEADQGDVFFLEPKELGGGCQRFPYREEEQEEQFYALMNLSRDFLRNKPVQFGKVAFLTEAKLLQVEQFKKRHMNVEEAVKLYEDKIELIQSTHQDEVMRKNEQLELQTAKVDRLKAQLDEAGQQVAEVKALAEQRVADTKARMKAFQDQMQYFKSIRSRPRTPKEVPEWVEKRFHEQMELHPRAVKLLQEMLPNRLDIHLLCDALEYLALEYRDQKNCFITRDEADERSRNKYGRSFTVVPSGESAINQYEKEYKVDYDGGGQYKPVKRALDLHLKTGNKSQFLLRIYFFYDDKRKKIVVGSLPEHLSTPTFS